MIVAFRLPARIEAIRRRHVPVATLGVPPHVTILFPFIPADGLDAGIRTTLARIAGRRRAFDVAFRHCAWFPDALYLQPTPARPLGELIADVSGAFSALPPYADPRLRAGDVEPHLTVAIGDRASLEPLLPHLTPELPVAGRARALSVIVEGTDGRWGLRWRLGFRP